MKNGTICPPQDCCGCMACLNICPNNAIRIVKDDLGASRPEIIQDTCTNCSLCEKACPMNSLSTLRKDCLSSQLCYAMWSNDSEERKICSSGGLATAFSRYILQQGGVVFGAAMDDQLILRHRMVSDENGLLPLVGSKYVQSDIGYTYRQVKQCLSEKPQVIFIGTPCQVGGLRSYLGKAPENLLTVDIICHGTPPMAYLTEHLHTQFGDLTTTNLTFRGVDDFKMTLWNENQIISKIPAHHDLYFQSFLKGLINRGNCYRCEFANISRVSDITIGDFWGIDRTTLNPTYDGRISVMIANTQKGVSFFEQTKHLFTYQQRPLEEAVAGNAQLRKSSVLPGKDRAIFEEQYKLRGFVGAIKQTTLGKGVLRSPYMDKLYATPLGSALLAIKKRLKG